MAKGNSWNSKVANRKAYRIRKARARRNRSKVARVTKSQKEQKQKREWLIPGNDIDCRGSRNYYPQAVYFFMRKHCLKCHLSFPTISDQILHMEKIHEGDEVCRRCYQPFPEGSDVRAPHSSYVHELFEEELLVI